MAIGPHNAKAIGRVIVNKVSAASGDHEANRDNAVSEPNAANRTNAASVVKEAIACVETCLADCLPTWT